MRYSIDRRQANHYQWRCEPMKEWNPHATPPVLVRFRQPPLVMKTVGPVVAKESGPLTVESRSPCPRRKSSLVNNSTGSAPEWRTMASRRDLKSYRRTYLRGEISASKISRSRTSDTLPGSTRAPMCTEGRLVLISAGTPAFTLYRPTHCNSLRFQIYFPKRFMGLVERYSRDAPI